jgi:DNA-binding NarL/FixJ family response regulator
MLLAMTPVVSTKVFVVDDSTIVRERLITLLAEVPNVTIAGEAEMARDAIAGIQSKRPDIVVLDISMPGGSGMKVLEAVKKDRPAPMVIMLTNFDHPQYRNRCMQLGADHFLDKSSNFERVIEIVRDFTPTPTPVPSPAAAPAPPRP